MELKYINIATKDDYCEIAQRIGSIENSFIDLHQLGADMVECVTGRMAYEQFKARHQDPSADQQLVAWVWEAIDAALPRLRDELHPHSDTPCYFDSWRRNGDMLLATKATADAPARLSVSDTTHLQSQLRALPC